MIILALFFVEFQQSFHRFDGYHTRFKVDRADDVFYGGDKNFSAGATDDIVVVAFASENIGNVADVFTPGCSDLKPDNLVVIILSIGQRVILVVLHFPQSVV